MYLPSRNDNFIRLIFERQYVDFESHLLMTTNKGFWLAFH